MIFVGKLVVLSRYEDVNEKKEDNIKEVNEDFVSMKGNLSNLKLINGSAIWPTKCITSVICNDHLLTTRLWR